MKWESRELAPENTLEQESRNALSIFAEASGAKPADIAYFQKLFEKLSLPESGIEAAHAIRRFLIEQGFQYDDVVFTLQDIRKKKAGNCLGLSLLIGGILLERGYTPSFSMVTHPKDAIAKKESELFERLTIGGVLDYDHPALPEHQAANPLFRFGPLQHPNITLDERPFETTGLDDVDESPEWAPDAELSQPLTYTNLAGAILTEQTKRVPCKTTRDCRKNIDLARKSLTFWPESADAFYIIWMNAKILGDDTTAQEAERQYLALSQGTSLALWGEYCVTQNPDLLTKILQMYPAFLFPFVEKNVIRESDIRDARFNFAVAAWCAGNSNVIPLKVFYENYRRELSRLFGEETAKRLTK